MWILIIPVALFALAKVRKSSGVASVVKKPLRKSVTLIPRENPKAGSASVQREASQPAPHLQNFIPIGSIAPPPNLTGEAMYNGEPLENELVLHPIIPSPMITPYTISGGGPIIASPGILVAAQTPIEPDISLSELALQGISADINRGGLDQVDLM